jgi:hypothetical protein
MGPQGEPGVSSRTQLLLEDDASGIRCYDAPGDGTVTLRADCCPTGFSAVGARASNLICLEDAPARARVALYLHVSEDLHWCDEVDGDCCAEGYTFVGWGEGRVVCLED